jgi:hypothetical protein
MPKIKKKLSIFCLRTGMCALVAKMIS